MLSWIFNNFYSVQSTRGRESQEQQFVVNKVKYVIVGFFFFVIVYTTLQLCYVR